MKSNKLRHACKCVLNYLKFSGVLIHGESYGSDELRARPECIAKLFTLVASQYAKEYGEQIPFTAYDVGKAYQAARKQSYRLLRDDIPIPTIECPLFKENDTESSPIAVVYAYWGSNQIAKQRLVKIGYTSQNLYWYLQTMQRSYDPILLACRCGNKSDEYLEHATYRKLLAEGREWFYRSEIMFDAFRRKWDVVPDFDDLVSDIMSGALDDGR